MQTKRSLLIVCALLATSADAIAQSPPTPATPSQQTAPPPPQSPTSCERMGSGGANAPRDSTVGRSHEPLGDKLHRSDGSCVLRLALPPKSARQRRTPAPAKCQSSRPPEAPAVTPISDRNRSASGLTVTPEDQERIYQFYHAGEKVSGAEGGGALLVAGGLSPC